MPTKTFLPGIGEHIETACKRAKQMSRETGQIIRFDFNGIPNQSSPKTSVTTMIGEFERVCRQRGEAYRLSRKGITDAENRRQEVERKQKAIDFLTSKENVDKVISLGMHSVLGLISNITEPADDIDVHFDNAKLANTLENAGYMDGFGVGNKPGWFDSKERMGLYIIGQAINCLKHGLPPHPTLTIEFIKQYDKLTV